MSWSISRKLIDVPFFYSTQVIPDIRFDKEKVPHKANNYVFLFDLTH